MKYEATVTGIGEAAFELLESCNCLVIFDDCAPAELAEISILHSSGEIKDDIKIGDKVTLGKNKYVITAIGDEALKTLKDMGHCTLKFTGKTTAELPGQIELLGEKISQIMVGDVIRFA
jgi:PTS system glucitol/sorbitol-specific IIA component